MKDRSIKFQFLTIKVSKNGMKLGWSRLRFLITRVVEIRVTRGQSEAFETKYIEFLY